MIQRFMPSC